MFICVCWPYFHIEMPEFTASQPLLWEPQISIFKSSLYPSVKRKKGLSSAVQVRLFGSHVRTPTCVPVCEFPNVVMVMV